jgi:phage FluMu gp28-like protein
MTYADSYKSCRDRNIIDYRRDLWFSSADESAALEYALYCKQWCEIMDVVAKEILKELEDDKGYKYNNYIIEFPNKSRINCLTSNPRRFRSKGGDIVLDEFAWHDQPREMLDAALPTTTWGFNIRILSTHNGEDSEFNEIIELCNRVLRGETTFDEANSIHYRLHRTTIIDAVEQGLAEKVYKLDRVDLEARAKFLKSCRARARNEDAWNQEYMCKPSSESTALIPYDLYQSCEQSDCIQPLVPHTEGRREYYLGGDIGREKHLTVFWIWERVGDVLICRKVIRLAKTPYGVQLQIASDLLNNQNIRRGCIDATGIGDMLVESLQNRFGSYRVEKIKFTAEIKSHLASLMLQGFEDKRIRVPADRTTRESFHSVRKTVTAAGNIRFDAATTEAGHADDFWAAACGKEAATTVVVPECILL